jgi:hypothetical protein
MAKQRFRLVIDSAHGGLGLGDELAALELAKRIAYDAGLACRVERVTEEIESSSTPHTIATVATVDWHGHVSPAKS